MKSYVIATALLFSSASVLANDYTFVNADGSDLGKLCIAAVDSDQSIRALADGMGISFYSADEVQCNGHSIVDFVHKYRSGNAVAAPRTSYIISSGNEAPETRLCLAALTSDEEFAKIKAAHFSGVQDIEQSVNCNNMPLSRFVRKYRDRLATGQSINTASL